MILRTRAPFGVEEDQPRPGEFLDAEEVELLAQLAVVALLGLFELGQIVVELFLGEERRAVDALQLRVLLVAFPIGAGDGEQLERLDLFGGGHMRAAAEIDEMRPQRVFGKHVVGLFGNQLDLHGLIAVQLQALLPWACTCARRAGPAPAAPTSSSRFFRGPRRERFSGRWKS